MNEDELIEAMAVAIAHASVKKAGGVALLSEIDAADVARAVLAMFKERGLKSMSKEPLSHMLDVAEQTAGIHGEFPDSPCANAAAQSRARWMVVWEAMWDAAPWPGERHNG